MSGMAAVGRMTAARGVVWLSFLRSLVTIVGILEARKRALSLARRTGIDDAMSSGSEGFLTMYLGWTGMMNDD